MKRNALRRAAGAYVVLSIFALLLGSGRLIGGTFAYFDGEVSNASSSFAGGWVGAPSAATSSVSGNDVSFTWTPGTHGPVTGQQIWGVDNLTNTNCTGAAYAQISTTLTASATTYTDASRGTNANAGDWFCYQVVSTSATVWTTPVALPAFQVGLVANALTTTNVLTSGAIAKTDTIKITFNQRTNLANANNIRVCTFANPTNVILIGDTANCVGQNDTTTIGKITVTGATLGSSINFNTSSTVVTTTAPFTVTVTITGSNSTSAVTGTPTWKFIPAATILSNATTHQATICSTASNTNCTPTATTNF